MIWFTFIWLVIMFFTVYVWVLIKCIQNPKIYKYLNLILLYILLKWKLYIVITCYCFIFKVIFLNLNFIVICLIFIRKYSFNMNLLRSNYFNILIYFWLKYLKNFIIILIIFFVVFTDYLNFFCFLVLKLFWNLNFWKYCSN